MKELDLVFRTIFAELFQRCLDRSFETTFTVEGRFVPVIVGGRGYWYFDRPQDGRSVRTYVGPKGDPTIEAQVQDFRAAKACYRAQKKLVSTLKREAGLPGVHEAIGQIVARLSSTGLLDALMILGTVAFQSYAGFLGVGLPVSLRKPVAGPLVLYRRAGLTEAEKAIFQNSLADIQPTVSVEVLSGDSVPEFLTNDPVRSLLLYKGGLPILTPSPERYAIHIQNSKTPTAREAVEAEWIIEAMRLTNRQDDIDVAMEDKHGHPERPGVAATARSR